MSKKNTSQYDAPKPAISRWPNRFALAMMCVTFPLIWAGGLVTSTDAGMAVHDWPTTFGYNMFLYPWQDWLFGPWDLFIEHGHRLLGTLAGILAIGFLLVSFRDRRGWLKLSAVAALLLVILQGTLGGVRVLADDRFIAMIHGCVGPAFFAFTVALVVFTSRFWRNAGDRVAAGGSQPSSSLLRIMTSFTAIAAYLQLILGANLRHVSVSTSPSSFAMLVAAHIVFAVVVALMIFFVAILFLRKRNRSIGVTRGALLLALLVLVQIALGCATWVVQYGWPGSLAESAANVDFTILSKGFLQTNITTAHVATGSLIIGIATWISVRTWRVTHYYRSGSDAIFDE